MQMYTRSAVARDGHPQLPLIPPRRHSFSSQNIQRMEAELRIANPGDFKDLDRSKTIDVDEQEGLQSVLTTMLHADADSQFMVQHTCVPCRNAHRFWDIDSDFNVMDAE